jgi:hypothetical protein
MEKSLEAMAKWLRQSFTSLASQESQGTNQRNITQKEGSSYIKNCFADD